MSATNFETVESLFDNADETFFSHALEADLIKSTTLNLHKTSLKSVGYSSYVFHFILGSILSLPHTHLKEKMNIEDIFVKVESINNSPKKNLKVFLTTTQNGGVREKRIIYRLLEFDEKSRFHATGDKALSDQDLTDLIWNLWKKGRNLQEYKFNNAKHVQIYKPASGQYDVIEEWKNDGADIVILDLFHTSASEGSPIIVKEWPIRETTWDMRVPEEWITQESGHQSQFFSVEALKSVEGQLSISTLEYNDPEQIKLEMTNLFKKFTQIFQTYDRQHNLKLSPSRIDHCGFIQGAISMNMKNKFKIALHVENQEVRHHDKVNLVLMTALDNPLHQATSIPVVIDFKDVDTNRATAKAVDHVLFNVGYSKLLPHVQTFSEKCIYSAVCLTSLLNPVAVTEVKLESRPKSISQLMIENAERLYHDFQEHSNSHLLADYDDLPELYKNRLVDVGDSIHNAFDTVQPSKKLSTKKNLRFLSRYLMGESGSSSSRPQTSPIYLAEDINREMDPLVDDLRKRLTTFVLETRHPQLDVIVHIFENPARHSVDSIYDATEYIEPAKTRTSVTHVLKINILTWFKGSGRATSQFLIKDFMGREVIVEPIQSYEVKDVEQSIKQLSRVNLESFMFRMDDMMSPSIEERENHLLPFFSDCQSFISNANEMVAVVKGLFSPFHSIQENIKSPVDDISGCQVIPFTESEFQRLKSGGIESLTQSRVLTFSFLDRRLSLMTGSGMFYNFPKFLEQKSGLATSSCNIIFNKRGKKHSQGKNAVVTTVFDHTNTLKNLKILLKSCLYATPRLKRDASRECKLYSNQEEIDDEPLIKSSKHENDILEPLESDRMRKYAPAKKSYFTTLNRLQKISSITIHGTIIESSIADLINGDYKGLCINVGFLAGGFALSHLADRVSLIGKRLDSAGRLALGRSLKISSPFIRRATSGLIIYDLISSIKRYKSNDTDAVVDIAEDGAFLFLDTVDIGVEIFEAVGVIEGVSAITGPIGLAIGAVVLVGADIYRAVRAVQKLDHRYHLTGWEKFKIGLKSFFHINLESTIKDLEYSRYDPLKTIISAASKVLQEQPNVRLYITPTLTTRSNPTFTELEKNNRVFLQNKRRNSNWLELTADQESSIVACRPKAKSNQKKVNGNHEYYLCENAIGVSRSNINSNSAQIVLINLENGFDTVTGMDGYPNVFLLGNGNKQITGGNESDTFVLTGNRTNGRIVGGRGQNVLDFSKYGSNDRIVTFNMSSSYFCYENQPLSLFVSEIRVIKGRLKKPDHVITNPNLSHLDLEGGDSKNYDEITIVDDEKQSAYNLNINVASYTKIVNEATNGKFVYLCYRNSSNSTVHLKPESKSAVHIFVFDYDYGQISSLNSASNESLLTFELQTMIYENKVSIAKINNMQIQGEIKNCIFQFRDKFFIYSPDGHKLIGSLESNRSSNEIINYSTDIVNRLKITLIAHSLIDNSTIVFANHAHEHNNTTNLDNLWTTIHNDPHRATHMIGGPEENIFVIISPGPIKPTMHEMFITADEITPDIFIHKTNFKNQKPDVIDLRDFYQKTEQFDDVEIKLYAITSNSSPMLHVVLTTPYVYHAIARIFLKNYTIDEVQNDFLILGNSPMKIVNYGQSSSTTLKVVPLPLKFNYNETKIILTHKDVEFGHEIIIERFLSKFSLFYSNKTDLIITDAFDRPFDSQSATILIIKDYYSIRKMSSLLIRFNNQVIKLNDKERFLHSRLMNFHSLSSDLWI